MRLPAALLLALLAVACSRGAPAVNVVSVRAGGGTLEPLREAGLDAAAVEGAAREALERSGFVLGGGTRPHRAELEVASMRLVAPNAAGGPPRVEVSVTLELAPEGRRGASSREDGTGSAPLDGSPRDAWRAALAQAASRAAEGLALGYREEAKRVEDVIADLRSKDARLRDHAVRVLAERRSAEAVPALIERLADEDPGVARRAVGALAQIGDERAVGPLIDLSGSEDGPGTARLARLIGDIGGAEARGYLLTIEAGHPDPRVRAAAREALRDLAAREAQAAGLSARK